MAKTKIKGVSTLSSSSKNEVSFVESELKRAINISPKSEDTRLIEVKGEFLIVGSEIKISGEGNEYAKVDIMNFTRDDGKIIPGETIHCVTSASVIVLQLQKFTDADYPVLASVAKAKSKNGVFCWLV